MVACSGTTIPLNRQPLSQDGGGNTTGAGGSPGDDSGPGAGGASGSHAGGMGGTATGGNGGGDGGSAGAPWDGVTSSDKLDLLIMVDNSSSMSDKQRVLAQTLPDVVTRLGGVKDLHVGVITSSLGAHGAPGSGGQPHLCEAGQPPVQDGNDHAHLLGTLPRAASLGLTKGFIEWTPSVGVSTLATQVQALINAAGQAGCGLEAQFEAMYRFLADPSPPQDIVLSGSPPRATPQGVDTEILNERRAFLRPDSALAIVMLTDENDCSIRDTDQYFYAAQLDVFLPKASSACGVNPNDPCCYSCGLQKPADCAQADPACGPPVPTLSPAEDSTNLRCFEQKRRFGIDFLYPVRRYINALSSRTLCSTSVDLDPNGNCPDRPDQTPGVVDNPIFQDLSNAGGPIRARSMVHFLTISGTPWQDLQAATDDQGNAYPAGELHYKSSAQLSNGGTWDQVLGNANSGGASPPILPTDPHMQESVDPRPGIPGPNAGFMADPINGHDWLIAKRDDLQYSCIFQLASAQPTCDSIDCDCFGRDPGDNNPLCQDANGTYVSNAQYDGKAYPGLRELALVQGLGQGAVAASICPRNLTDQSQQDYGYRPAVEVLAKDLQKSLP